MAPRISHAHRPLGFKGRVWLGLGSVLLGGAGVSAVAFADTQAPHAAPPKAASHRPVTPRLFHNSLGALPLSQSTRPTRTLTQRSTEPFNLLGVSWDDPAAKVSGTIQVRTRSIDSGTWTDWTELAAADGAADPKSTDAIGTRGATEPLWTGPSNGVELRITPGSGSTKLPAGLRLDYIASGNLGSSTAATAPAAQARAATLPDAELAAASSSPSASPSPSVCTSAGTTATMPATPTSTVRKPVIVSREQWGADESIRDQTLPCYNTAGVQAVFVHHTADDHSDYVCSTDPTNPKSSAAWVQAEYTYHVKSNGWRDLGYNFMVDKCGTIFEGRWGGLNNGGGEALPVFGAHTYGFNAGTMGVAVLGTYTSVNASNAVLGALATLTDWKLGMYGHKPGASVTMVEAGDPAADSGTKFPTGTSVSFNNISGHRDGYKTECPGNDLYAQLPSVRQFAAGPAPAPVITGAGAQSSGVWYTSGKPTVTWTESWYSSLIDHFEVLVDGQVTATVANTARSAALTLAAGKHTVAVRAVHIAKTTSVSANATVVAATPGKDTDWSHDGKADLLVRSSTGAGSVYYGTTLSTHGSTGSGWQAYNVAVQSDLDQDGLSDLVVRSTSGTLYWRHISGTAWVNSQLATGWGSVRQIAVPGDLTGDKKADLLIVDSAGTVWVYPGKGNGTFSARIQVGSGLQSYAQVVGHGDFTGDGKVDLMARTTAGGLYLWPGTGTGKFGARKTVATGFASANGMATVGDVTGDGKADLLIRMKTGQLYIYPGKGNGTFGSKTVAAGNWSSLTILG
ncbi:FG-GAP-like repeat-containing protein [Peterkaempfera sp. SMS 1(5)a]|uniref:FG-GAP-like repeat-containing protein n=1 Tax=Peterkaempfera podocarpi TaxID=3232308 RepID=UPI00366E32CF